MHIQRLVDTARMWAEKSTMNKRVGAAVRLKSRELFGSANLYKTHPKSPSPWSMHAEVSAILRSQRFATRESGYSRMDLHGATLCVVRITKSGLFAMSFPCRDCLKAIKENGISRVVFTGPDRLVYETKGI